MTESTAPQKKSLLRRLLKWTGITFLLLIIAAIVLPFLFKDKIIAMAKQQANDNLNATVSFGDFDLSLLSSFPDFRFSIADVKIVGKDQFAKDTLANIKLLKLDLNIMSVIKGDAYQINSIYLEKPRLLAKVLKDGKANWDITKPAPETPKPVTAEEPTKFKLSLKSLEIKEGYIVYDDATLAVRTVLDNMNHTLKGDFTENNFLMETATSIERFTVEYDGVPYLLKTKTDLQADLDMDMTKMKFVFKENELKLNDLGLHFDGFFAMPGDDMDMDLKFKALQADFKSFLSLIPGAYTKDFADVKATGKLAFDGYAKGLYSEKQNKMPGYGLNFQINDGTFKYPSVPKTVSAINIDCKIDDASGVTNDMKIDVNKFHIDFGGNPVDAALHVTTPVTDANLDGWVKGKMNLATLREFIPLEQGDELNGNVAADVKMKGRMSSIEKEQYEQFQCNGTVDVTNMLYKTKGMDDTKINNMSMKFSPEFVELTKFDALLGKNDVRADGRIENFLQYIFKDSLLTGKFNLASTNMDLNAFAGEEETTTTASDSSAMTIIEVPANLDFVMNSAFAKLIYDDITMTNVAGGITIRNSTVNLDHLKMNTMGGNMTVTGFYNTLTPLVPKVNFNLDIVDFDIQQTVKTFNTIDKLAPVGKHAKGRFSTTLNYVSTLDQAMMPVLSSITGRGILRTKAVEIEGFEPLKKLDEALKLNKFKKTTLNDLNVGYRIENGRVTVDPFDMKMGKTMGKMQGSTGLDQTIDYTLDIAIPRTEFGPANAALNGWMSSASAKGIPVKLGDMVNVKALFGGTVTQPTVKANLKEAAGDMVNDIKQTLKDTAKAIVSNAVDKGKEEARKKADKLIADAQVKADAAKNAAYQAADNVKTEAYKQADILEKKQEVNPLKKAANKVAADAMRKKADDANAAAKRNADAAHKASMDKARAEADALLK
jgi:hypothetical protein